MTRTHPAGAAGVRNSSQTTLSLCFCAGKAASFQSPGPGRSRTPVLGGGVQPEPVCVGLGAAQWRRAWSLSERAASSKIGSLRSFSGSGHRDLKRDQRDRFPPADCGRCRTLRSQTRTHELPETCVSDSEQSQRAGSGGRLARKQAVAAVNEAGTQGAPLRARPDRTMPVRKKGKPLSLGAVCVLAANG